MKRTLYLGFVLLATLLFQCSNSQKLLSDGNYEKSYKVSLKELNKGKASANNVEILNASIENIYDQRIEEILESENGESLDDGVAAYYGYDELEDTFREALKYLDVKNNERYTSVLDRKEKLGYELYEDFKRAGIGALQHSKENDSRGAARDAFNNFEKARQYNATDEVEDLMEEAYEIAVTILVVETELPYNPSFSYDVEREFKRVENIDNDKFQRAFYDDHQKDADCIIKIVFDQFDFRSDFQTFSNDYTRAISVQRNTVNADGQTVTVTDTENVSCTLYTERTISGLRMFANIAVVPQTDQCNSSRDTYQDYYEEVYEVYNVVGDARALPPGINRTSNGQRVRDRDLVEALVRRFYNSFAVEYL